MDTKQIIRVYLTRRIAATGLLLCTLLAAGSLQADGTTAPEPTMDVGNVAATVVHMASLPLDANIQFLTVMATTMPFIGRG